jgi:diaminohydroxyphosphoribosylaminopyrimidine deaminase/5-amino-6-(5-phosphoribosylamino)uracil reductase
VLDSHLRTPPSARVLDEDAPTLIVCAPEAVASQRSIPSNRILSCPHHVGGLGLSVVLAELAQRGVNELQVESGATLAGALLHAGLVDELLLYQNFSVIGDSGRPLFQLPPLKALDARPRWRCIDQRLIGDDLRLLLRPLD